MLEHCSEEKPTVGSPFFGEFPSDRILKAKKILKYISLFTVVIHVNYTREFLETLNLLRVTAIEICVEKSGKLRNGSCMNIVEQY